MEYQEIITEYSNGKLDISELKRKMEIAKLLQGRFELRAADIVENRITMSFSNHNMLIIPEIPERKKAFDRECNSSLEEYYKVLIDSIKSTKAWKIMGLVPSEHTLDRFRLLDKKSQFKMIFLLNEKYQEFLKYQKVADVISCLKDSSNIDDETLKKMMFLNKMFEALNNDDLKTEFYAFSESPQFLMALIAFKKSKNKTQKLEDFIKGRSKEVKKDYKMFSTFFSTEDFRDIAENLLLTSKTLKVPVTNVIDVFCEMSEGELEQRVLEDEHRDFEKIEEKYWRFVELEKDFIRDKIKRKRENEVRNDKKNTTIPKIEKTIKPKEEPIKVPSDVTIINSKKIGNKPKERVKPIIFTWIGREDISLGKRVGLKNLTAYLDDIHKKELETGTRASLFLVTNADKEVTVKRMEEIQKRAKARGMPDFVEGAFGGYSSFFIDSQANITDVATMSDENRQKIIKLLDSSFIYTSLMSEKIDESEQNYVRYVFSDRKDKSITMNSLRAAKNHILKNPRVKIQPIKIIPFIEGRFSGIDVLLEHQFLGIRKILDYYKFKYEIAAQKGEKIYITLEDLLEYTLEAR